ncbi:hypothetical protein ElyMa_003883400 [Elysia marginata]|uniref:Uncharacterized protein n=1 Tax=Elysia marginata TaxID=1093978 RepID=A0AAV4FMB9_9GAST|nr:hypothetical protein ElyMa_003883400 [Elysia marginata]
MKIFAAFVAFKSETQTLEPTAFAGYQDQNWNRERLWSVYTVVVEDVLADTGDGNLQGWVVVLVTLCASKILLYC